MAPLGLGQDEVDPGLGQPPQVGQLRLQLGAGVTLAPQAAEGQTLEPYEVIGAQSIGEIELSHRLRLPQLSPLTREASRPLVATDAGRSREGRANG